MICLPGSVIEESHLFSLLRAENTVQTANYVVLYTETIRVSIEHHFGRIRPRTLLVLHFDTSNALPIPTPVILTDFLTKRCILGKMQRVLLN